MTACAVRGALGGEMRTELRRCPCGAFSSDQRVKVNAGRPYPCPDLSMACAPRFVVIDGLRTLENPVLLVEVMFPSTAENDRGAQFLHYQTIPTLRDDLSIDSTEVAVLHYRRWSGCWGPQLIDRIDAALTLGEPSVNVSLPEIYLDTGL